MKLPNGYGAVVKEHQKYADTPTFAELYDKWCKYRKSLKTNSTASTWKKYNIAFGMYAPIHHKKIISLRASELQECITAQGSKSKTTVGNMRAIVRGMWQYAVVNEYVKKDITQHLVFEGTPSGTPIHTRFTDKEIAALWDALWTVNNVDIVLIFIYTEMRPGELLEVKSENVHLKEKYIIGGFKTEAGRDRIVTLHDAIIPQKRFRSSLKPLISSQPAFQRKAYLTARPPLWLYLIFQDRYAILYSRKGKATEAAYPQQLYNCFTNSRHYWE